jgi:hypothetical protein
MAMKLHGASTIDCAIACNCLRSLATHWYEYDGDGIAIGAYMVNNRILTMVRDIVSRFHSYWDKQAIPHRTTRGIGTHARTEEYP